jgi:MYXO-CTERM domain-containing protein
MCGVVGLLACGQSFGTELLIDPGMNSIGPNGQLGHTPDAPWVFTASRGANLAFDDGATSEAFADHDGGGFGLFFKAFVGNPPWDPTAGSVDAHIYQDVAGTPGTTYTLTGWWGAEDNYSGLHTPGANAIFALDFLTGGGGLIGSTELDLEAAGLGDPSLAGFNYEQFVIMAVAPAGTVTVRARGSMLDGVFFLDPGQALVTDQWSLTARSTPTPEPGTALMGGLAALALLGSARRRRRES